MSPERLIDLDITFRIYKGASTLSFSRNTNSGARRQSILANLSFPKVNAGRRRLISATMSMVRRAQGRAAFRPYSEATSH